MQASFWVHKPLNPRTCSLSSRSLSIVSPSSCQAVSSPASSSEETMPQHYAEQSSNVRGRDAHILKVLGILEPHLQQLTAISL